VKHSRGEKKKIKEGMERRGNWGYLCICVLKAGRNDWTSVQRLDPAWRERCASSFVLIDCDYASSRSRKRAEEIGNEREE